MQDRQAKLTRSETNRRLGCAHTGPRRPRATGWCQLRCRRLSASPAASTRTVPILDRPKNVTRRPEIEAAKRRVLFALQHMDLPVIQKSEDAERGPAFDSPETLPPPVLTGHAEGVITLNVAESLREPYRTAIGHIRHELGHRYGGRARFRGQGCQLPQRRFGLHDVVARHSGDRQLGSAPCTSSHFSERLTPRKASRPRKACDVRRARPTAWRHSAQASERRPAL